MRILLLQSILSCLSREEGNQPWDPPLLEVSGTSVPIPEELQKLVNNIFASVPYLLDEFDQDGSLKSPQQKKAVGALFLLWPLRLLLFCGPIDSAQRAWITERLMFIRNVFGIHKATEPL